MARKRLKCYNELACFVLWKILRIFLMTSMNRAKYFLCKWKFDEDKAKVIVRDLEYRHNSISV